MNPLYELLELIATGEQEQADELFDSLVGERVSDILDQTRADLAAQIFASTEGEVIEEGEVKKANKAKKNVHMITSGKRKIDPKRAAIGVKESTELLDEGNKENKAKKNDYLEKRGKKILGKLDQEGSTEVSKRANTAVRKSWGKHHRKDPLTTSSKDAKRSADLKGSVSRKLSAIKSQRKPNLPESTELQELSKKTLGSYVSKAASDAFGAGHDAGSGKLGSAKSMKGYEKGTKRLTGIRKATKKLSEAMSDEMKAKVKADMEKRRAAKNAALDSAKKEMEGWKPDKKDLRKLYKKED